MQRDRKEEELQAANKHYQENYIMARQRGYTQNQAKNYAKLERDDELSESSSVFNFPSTGPAAYAQRFADNQYLMTPTTPDNYNR